MVRNPTHSRPILVAHPTRQHSHQLAAALSQENLLNAYVAMLPDWRNTKVGGFAKIIVAAGSRLGTLELPSESIRCWVLPWALKRGADQVWPAAAPYTKTCAFSVFDWWVSRLLPLLNPAVFVGYEEACRRSFETAKRMGVTCVLDAAAFSTSWQERYLTAERDRGTTILGRYVRNRKQAEVDSADLIMCCSELAAQSYLELGVRPDSLIVNRLGCDVALFSSHERCSKGAMKFCFVGMPSETKGFEYMLTSFRAHCRQYPSSELHIVGDAAAARRLGASEDEPGINIHGKKTQTELAHFLAGMDVLLLPSLLDAFGMVVTEALAAGLYLIVSNRVGAKTLIQNDQVGIIVQAADSGALTVAMNRVASEIHVVRSQAESRRILARAHDWAEYKKRAVVIFKAVLNRKSFHHSSALKVRSA